ncbi:MAG: hypothetical protein M0R75_11830 [Dehalococcoidia bacterium]|nr:hypothetical protein [Dehalococcoidia bacterium]
MTVRTQTRYPTTVVSDDAVGTLAWSDPDKAEVEDNDPATATGPGTTEYLLASGYGFEGTLPSTCDLIEIALLPRRRNALAQQAITEVDTTTASGIGTSLSINVPDGVVDSGAPGTRDVLILTVRRTGSTSAIDLSGWEEVGTASVSPFRLTVLRRVADSEPASYSLSLGANGSSKHAVMTAWRGVDNSSPLASDVSPSGNANNPTSHVAPEVTTTVANALLNLSIGFEDAIPGTVTPPSGMDTTGSVGSLRVFTETVEAAGATGSRTTTTANGVDSARVMFALRPAPATVVDDAVRLVVGGVVGDGDRSSATPWAQAYQTDTLSGTLAEWDFADLVVGDIDSDFGCALSATIDGPIAVDIDALPIRITYDVPMAVTITAPTADITQPNPEVTWGAEVDGSAIVQASSRVRILSRPSLAVLYDSGVVAGATQAHVVGSGTPSTPWATPQNGQAIRIEVTVTEDGTADPDGTGDPISGSATFDCTTDFTLPAAPTGLAAVAVTEAS